MCLRQQGDHQSSLSCTSEKKQEDSSAGSRRIVAVWSRFFFLGILPMLEKG